MKKALKQRSCAIMTSLAKQLQRLALPGQASMRQVVSKRRPSFLFSGKEAADIAIETIYELGTNGLEELISIDETFREFQDSLFHEGCKDFERTVQHKGALEAMDAKIASFLCRLSPYFLLRAAHKCLEWLIRAFRINSFNVDAVMECILPYHQTKLFVRMLQLLPIKAGSSPWHWLCPLQKAGSPLSRQAIVQRCLSDLSFLRFLGQIMASAVREHKSSSLSPSPPPPLTPSEP